VPDGEVLHGECTSRSSWLTDTRPRRLTRWRLIAERSRPANGRSRADPPFGAVTTSRPAEPSPVHKRVICVVACFHSYQSGLTSIAPLAAAGCLAAISTASSRLAHSMMSKPPICALVSGERAIGYQHLAVADADGGGIAAWPEPRAAAPDPRASTSASQAWICGRACTSAGSRSPIRHPRSSACTSWPSFGRDHRAALAQRFIASGADRCQLTPVRLAGAGHGAGGGSA
jgi:hypothetical protein